jgi:hypothetical protein
MSFHWIPSGGGVQGLVTFVAPYASEMRSVLTCSPHSKNLTSLHSNHNPLPDMTHDEFVSRLGPVLAPENYDLPPPPPTPTSASATHSHARKRSGSGHHTNVYGSPPSGYAPPNGSPHNTYYSPSHTPYAYPLHPGTPPFDWMHFEGRAPQTTLANLTGLDGLARERGWRARCVFSLEVARGGVEAVCLMAFLNLKLRVDDSKQLIPHADVVFFS